MSAVSAVTSTVTINIAPVYTLSSSVITAYPIPASFQTTLSLLNGNGAALAIDLAAWGTVSLASTSLVVDFSSLADPGAVTQDWVGGRVRIFIIQVTTTTAGYDLEVYADATNGVSFLPPVANTLTVSANGGQLIYTDFNSNGSGAGTKSQITSSHKRLDFNSGSNTVAFNWLALGSSVA